jgi:hypothetical protein
MSADASALEQWVRAAVRDTPVVDVHTHLFPASHGPLFAWGIDELLTYHYLCAEVLSVARGTPAKVFYGWSKSKQADHVWEHLFVRSSPVSEACIGVLTALRELGLSRLVAARDLAGIRAWYATQTPESFQELVFRLAKVRYVVMTNIPFEPLETKHWLQNKPCPSTFRSALRVDPLLTGDWPAVSEALAMSGHPQTLEGARTFLRSWAERIKPLYLMASTPAGFALDDGSDDAVPAAAAGDLPSAPTARALLEEVMLRVAQELNLPVALKVGAERGVNPAHGAAGDGICVADLGVIKRLCARFPNVRFLVTVLSRVNQHALAVLSRKFPNLHLYGCWWFCNNPSIIADVTRMRLELLGLNFTAQHSDCRVIDQLLYKWRHSREVIADALVPYYARLAKTGWVATEKEVQRDVRTLLGGAFEAFASGP